MEKEAVVKQFPPSDEEPAASQTAGRLPRITRLMEVRFEGMLREATVKDYSDLARLGGVSRARITQIMQLRNLAPLC